MRTLLLLVGLTACNTPCERLCVAMYDYAAECPDVNVPESQLDSCLAEQADAEDQGACRAAGDAETLRAEWDCQDLKAFFEP